MSYCALILFFSPPFQILEEIDASRCIREIGISEEAAVQTGNLLINLIIICVF